MYCTAGDSCILNIDYVEHLTTNEPISWNYSNVKLIVITIVCVLCILCQDYKS